MKIPRINVRDALTIAAVAMALLIVVWNPTQDSIAQADAVTAHCQAASKAAREAISSATTVPILQAALLEQIGKVSPPRNETEMVADAWIEASRIARRHHVVLTDVSHEPVKAAAISVPVEASSSESDDAKVCLAGGVAQVQTTDTSPSPSASPSGSPTQPILVLPMNMKQHGDYTDQIGFIADLAGSRVLMQYSSISFMLPQDAPASGAVTVFLFPPIRIDENGHPTQSFAGVPNMNASPGASPSPTPQPKGA